MLRWRSSYWKYIVAFYLRYFQNNMTLQQTLHYFHQRGTRNPCERGSDRREPPQHDGALAVRAGAKVQLSRVRENGEGERPVF